MSLSVSFSALETLPPETAVEYLRGALQEAYREIQLPAIEALEKRQRHDVVIQSFSTLLPEIRNRVEERKNEYFAGAKSLIFSGMERERRAAYAFLAATGEIEAAGMLARGVDDASTLVRDHVADALEKIALRYHYHLLNWRIHGDVASAEFIETHRDSILDSLERLLRTFAIHQKDVFVDIAVESGESTYRLITEIVLARKDSALQNAFFRVMNHSNSPTSTQLLFRLLQDPDERMSDFARALFNRRRDPHFVEILGRYLTDLGNEGREELASRLKDLPWWEALADHSTLPPVDLEPHLNFIFLARLPTATKERYLRHFLQAPEGRTRARALEKLREINASHLMDNCKSALSDPDGTVQLTAARCLVEMNPPGATKILAPLLQSDSEAVRRYAMKQVAHASLERYLHGFDRLGGRTRELAAKALAKIDSGMLDRLSEEIHSLDPARRLKALRILDLAEMERDAQPILRDLLSDPDHHVRSAVIKLVQIAGNHEAIQQVIQLLGDPDARVRANAIEAFEDIGDTRFVHLLSPFTQAPDNRIRANAVKALWNLGRREVIDVLREMLHHDDPKMRMSAVWTFGEIRPEGTNEWLTERLSRETNDEIRARIRKTISGPSPREDK